MKHDYPIVITEPDFVRLFGLNTTQSLATKLNTAVVLRSGPIPSDLVTVNSTIVYEDEYTGARRKITIVYPPDADPSKGNVSVLTPRGNCFAGTVHRSIDRLAVSRRQHEDSARDASRRFIKVTSLDIQAIDARTVLLMQSNSLIGNVMDRILLSRDESVVLQRS